MVLLYTLYKMYHENNTNLSENKLLLLLLVVIVIVVVVVVVVLLQYTECIMRIILTYLTINDYYY